MTVPVSRKTYVFLICILVIWTMFLLYRHNGIPYSPSFLSAVILNNINVFNQPQKNQTSFSRFIQPALEHGTVVPPSLPKQTFQMQHCACNRSLPLNEQSSEKINFEDTTCGRDAYRRGKGQKVVAFAFYGDINSELEKSRGYFRGL